MKKKLICLGAGMLMLGMVSCNNGSTSTQTITIPICSLVTPINGGADVSVTEGTYTFNMDNSLGTIALSTTGLEVDGSKYSFSTDPVKSTSVNDPKRGTILRVTSTSPGIATGATSLALSDLSCSIYPYVIYDLPYVPGINTTMVQVQPIIISYKIGDYLVRTFQSDTFVSGMTVSEFKNKEGLIDSYTNTSTLYRVVMNIPKKTANVVLYSVKFAEQMPEIKTMLLKDLSLTFDASGFTVKGSNIVPSVVENTTSVPNDKFPFDSFVLKTIGNDMTDIICDFNVAGRYKGSFSGSVIPILNKTEK